MSRISNGSQGFEMVNISKESNLLVTFLNRRFGVSRKADEVSILSGAEVTIVVFLPGNKVFSFCHTSVETTVDRFLSRNPPQISGSLQLTDAHGKSRLPELNMVLIQTINELEMEKKQGEELDQIRKITQAQQWWESPVEELDLTQLKQLKASLEMMLGDNVGKQAEQLLFQATNSPEFYAPTSNGVVPFDLKNRGFNTNMMPYQYPNLGYGGFC